MKHADARRGGIVMGLLLTAAGLVCLAIVVGFAIARNVRVHESEGGDHNDVMVETPAGNFSMRAYGHPGRTLADVPEYPGSHRSERSGGADFQWTSNDGRADKSLSVAGGEMITSDSADQVLKFYRDQLPSARLVEESNHEVHLEYSKGGYKRYVVIHAKSDGTHIGVATIGEPAAN